MCNYCAFKPNGDTGERYEPIVDEPTDIGLTLVNDGLTTVNANIRVSLGAEVWHESESGEWNLTVFIADDYDPAIIQDHGMVFSTGKINFCPMCGRRLDTEKVDEERLLQAFSARA